MTGNARTAGAAIAAIALTAMAIGAISASAGGESGENQLTGAWMVAVDRGPALPALKSLQTYTKGHGVVEIANGGATARSPGHGAWRRVAGSTYGTTVVFFRYDPATGVYLGTVKIRHTLELSRDGDAFTGVAVGELRDPAGNLLPGSNTRRDVVSAERIHVEPVPELP
ncbi:MAG: hypothetical protein ACRDMZ_24070 [Solirubrobacteraceae bacterium]